VMVPNKFVAFAGPHRTRQGQDGYPQLTPEDYFPIWKKYNVSTIVRLNRKMYDAHKFVDAGFKHYDLFFIDGTTPSREILDSFIHLAEQDEGIMAVHCKAGLGRTGTLIGCYIMKHYKFTADECIAWMRICRPGSVIGPQQQYLIAQQPRMWAEGEAYRKEHGLKLPWEDWMDNEEYIDTPTSHASSSSSDPASPQTPMALSAKPLVTAVTPRSPTEKQKADRKKRADNASTKIYADYPNQDPLSAKKAPQEVLHRETATRTSNYAPVKLQF
jgi:protein-tyrosine phosphatase